MRPVAGIEARDLVWHPPEDPGRVVIDRLSLIVPAGAVRAITGHNGAGKTTLLRLIAGLLRPVSGRARVAGHEVTAEPRSVRAVVGLVPEQDGLPDRLTAIRHVRHHALLRGIPWREATRRAVSLLGELGVDEPEAPLGTLSRGMRRRVVLCRALVHDPAVILIDEPEIHLDSVTAGKVRDLIRRRREEGCAVLLATHHPEWIGPVCDGIDALRGGRVEGAS